MPRVRLLAPFAYIAGVVAIGTFYLAQFYLPFVFGLVAIGAGMYVHIGLGRSVQSTVAMALGAAGILLGLVDRFFL